MAIEFRLIEDSQETTVLPDVQQFQLSPVLCDAGAVTLSYPADGTNFAAIRDLDEFNLAVYVNGVRQGGLDCVIKEIDGDEADDTAVWKYTGFFANGRMSEAIVYPKGWPTVTPEATRQQFGNATAGQIMGVLMGQAQNRGTLTDILATSFSATHDSNGVAWTKKISIEYAPKVDYLTILRNLYLQGLCEWEVVNSHLRMYVPGTLSTDRTTGTTPLVFRKGRDVSDSPRKVSTRDLGTVLLAEGAEGLYVERVSAPAVASRRRIEGSASQGGINDSGTLSAYADAELALIANPKMEKTHGLEFTGSNPQPIRDFAVGDWAYSDTGNGLERLRIKQWVLSLESNGSLGGSVVLNDLIAEREELLTRRIEGIVGGSTLTGGSQATDVVPDELVDNIGPKAPEGLSVTSEAYFDAAGNLFSQGTASWLAPTQNSDDSVLTDLSHYRVRWQQPNVRAEWTYITTAGETIASWSPMVPGETVQVQVQAIDKYSNGSAWSPAVSIITGVDAVPPEEPPAPSMENYLGLLKVTWNGLGASGAAMPSDLKHVEVHVSTVSNFTPSATTFRGVLTAAGPFYVEVPYATTHYARLVAVDRTDNKSAPSAQGTGTASQVVSSDVFDGAIGTAKLANLAVTTAKINDLAVNDAKIGSVSVGKLTAGTINVDVLVGGRIATALSGARREMNAVGFQAWDANGNQVINLDGVNNLVTGRFRTGLSGTRRLEMGMVSNATSIIKFFAPDGKEVHIGGFTGGTGVEVLRNAAPVTGTHQLWNMYQLQSDESFHMNAEAISLNFGGYFNTTRSGGFYVREALTRGTSTTAPTHSSKYRVYIDGTRTNFHYQDQCDLQMWANGFYLNWAKTDDSVKAGLQMDTNQTYLFSTKYTLIESNGEMRLRVGGLNHNLLVKQGAIQNHGVHLCQMTNDGFGGGWMYNQTSDGVGFQLLCLWWDRSLYMPIVSAGHSVGSARKTKAEIVDLQGSALDRIRPVRARQYKRVQSKANELGRTEIGLIAEEAPPEIVWTPSGMEEQGAVVDHYALSTLTAAAVAELVERVEALERGPR